MKEKSANIQCPRLGNGVHTCNNFIKLCIIFFIQRKIQLQRNKKELFFLRRTNDEEEEEGRSKKKKKNKRRNIIIITINIEIP
jgi:hypothetical protein